MKMANSAAPIRIGITGAGGFLGWHLRCHLHADPSLAVVACDRESFADSAFMQRFVSECDVIVHIAGANRGQDDEIGVANVSLAERLAEFLRKSGAKPHVVYTSSVHIERDTPYGRSKLQAGQILSSWAAIAGAPFLELVLPNIFGECGRPFYNSVVATFCRQLADGVTPTVHVDAEIELMHAQEVAAEISNSIRHTIVGVRRCVGQRTTVTELLRRLTMIDEEYRASVVPSLQERFNLNLFNTFRSYLFPAHYPVRFIVNSDARGHLFECVRSLHGGQCFVSTTKPGITRGNHYHTRKFERFAVIQGQAIIRIRKLLGSAVHEFRVSGDQPSLVDMPTLHTHSIENIGTSELVTLFWSHEFFDRGDPDTFFEKVLL